MSLHDINNEELEEEFVAEESPPQHNDTEGVWLISYADLMTLLMGFFALMASMANFDEQTFNAVGEATAEYLGGEVDQPFEEVGEKIQKLIEEKQLAEQIKLDIQKTKLEIRFEGTLLFGSGDYGLKPYADELMNEIAKILGEEASNKKVLIEGHTDDSPINKGLIASNWELSSLRSNRVARLFEAYGFKQDQILTLGFGATRPVAPNRTPAGEIIPENQAKNRRVILKVMNQHPI